MYSIQKGLEINSFWFRKKTMYVAQKVSLIKFTLILSNYSNDIIQSDYLIPDKNLCIRKVFEPNSKSWCCSRTLCIWRLRNMEFSFKDKEIKRS